MATQKERILTRLQAGEILTRLFCAREMTPGIMESPARICELRNDGHDIKTRMETIKSNGQTCRIAHWSLAKPAPRQGILI